MGKKKNIPPSAMEALMFLPHILATPFVLMVVISSTAFSYFSKSSILENCTIHFANNFLQHSGNSLDILKLHTEINMTELLHSTTPPTCPQHVTLGKPQTRQLP